MKITRRILPALMAVPVAAGLITACSPLTVNATNCSHQQCVTTHATVGPAATQHDHHQPAPPTRTAQPASTVTVTATPTPTPTPSPAVTQAAAVTSAQVEQCLAPVTGGTPQPQSVIRLESAQAWGNLGGCLQIPTAEFDKFVSYAVRLVVQAAADGQLADTQHCQQWEDDTLTPAVQRYQ